MRAEQFVKKLYDKIAPNMARIKEIDRHRVLLLAEDGTPFNVTVHKVKDRISKNHQELGAGTKRRGRNARGGRTTRQLTQ